MFFRKQKATGNDNRPVSVTPTYIGADTAIEGNISAEGEIHIEGSVRGIVTARKCVLLESGTIEGEVNADDVIVHGRVTGPLRASHVHLQNGAIVEGDITSDTIAIETGARLSGAVWQNDRQSEPEPMNGRALMSNDSSGLFSDSLWNHRQNDDNRPLKAVRPKASNGSWS
jgi:cytoskeletal protein CcmA (bactofilin family)